MGGFGLGLGFDWVLFGVEVKGDDKWGCQSRRFESKRESESIGAFLDHSILPVPFSISVYLIVAEPSLKLCAIFEYDRALALHLVLFERPEVLKLVSCQPTNPVSLILPEKALIKLFVGQLQSALPLHFPIFELPSINSTIGKELLSFS